MPKQDQIYYLAENGLEYREPQDAQFYGGGIKAKRTVKADQYEPYEAYTPDMMPPVLPPDEKIPERRVTAKPLDQMLDDELRTLAKDLKVKSIATLSREEIIAKLKLLVI